MISTVYTQAMTRIPSLFLRHSEVSLIKTDASEKTSHVARSKGEKGLNAGHKQGHSRRCTPRSSLKRRHQKDRIWDRKPERTPPTPLPRVLPQNSPGKKGTSSYSWWSQEPKRRLARLLSRTKSRMAEATCSCSHRLKCLTRSAYTS